MEEKKEYTLEEVLKRIERIKSMVAAATLGTQSILGIDINENVSIEERRNAYKQYEEEVKKAYNKVASYTNEVRDNLPTFNKEDLPDHKVFEVEDFDDVELFKIEEQRELMEKHKEEYEGLTPEDLSKSDFLKMNPPTVSDYDAYLDMLSNVKPPVSSERLEALEKANTIIDIRIALRKFEKETYEMYGDICNTIGRPKSIPLVQEKLEEVRIGLNKLHGIKKRINQMIEEEIKQCEQDRFDFYNNKRNVLADTQGYGL